MPVTIQDSSLEKLAPEESLPDLACENLKTKGLSGDYMVLVVSPTCTLRLACWSLTLSKCEWLAIA